MILLSAALAACTPKSGTPADNEGSKITAAPTSDANANIPTGADITGTETNGTDITGTDSNGNGTTGTEPNGTEPSDNGSGTVPADWNPDIKFTTTDLDLFNWDDTCFANAKVTMINLWAYWCGPCVGELPELNKLSEEYADKGFQLFGLTYPEEERENRETVDELGLTYQMLLYTDDFDSYMDSGYLPTTIFVDSNGHVIGEPMIGSRSYEEWKELIEEYLAK